jgi:predicted DNA-binding protein with PD1-like motif
MKEKNCKKKIKEETEKYSKAAAAIEKFYVDASKGKISEKDFPHDHAKIALENHKIIIELLDQLKKLEKG